MKKPISPTQRMLNVWAVILIIWSVYRTYYKTDLPIWIDEFIAKPFIFLTPLYYYISRVEKKSFFERIDFHTRGLNMEVVLGVGAGMFFLIAGMVSTQSQANTSFFSSSPNTSGVAGLVGIIIISFVSSISEEILSRGFVLKRLYEESKNMVTSVFFASFLFFFLHIPILFSNPTLRGNALLQVMMTDMMLSFAVSLIYLQRKSIVSAIIIHALYNISIYLFL